MRFSSAMKAYSESSAFDLTYVLDHYEWASLGPVKVVDVGGSQGHVSKALATRFDNLDITVQDFEAVIQGAGDSLPEQLKDRVRFMAHNFFAPQPIQADVYYCRWIFHNWSDKYSIAILRSLVPALKPGARLLIQEIRMPEPNDVAQWRDKIFRFVIPQKSKQSPCLSAHRWSDTTGYSDDHNDDASRLTRDSHDC